MEVIEQIFRAELPELLSRRWNRSVPVEHSGAPTLSLPNMFSGISVPAAAAMRLRTKAAGRRPYPIGEVYGCHVSAAAQSPRVN
eukprot:745832-Prymnesium_polylepis.1